MISLHFNLYPVSITMPIANKLFFCKTNYTCNCLKVNTYDHGHFHDETGNTTDENKTDKGFLYLLDEKNPV